MNLTEYIAATSATQEKIGEMAGGVGQSFVSQWIKGTRPIPAKRARHLEANSGGQMTKEELCPGVFGPLEVDPDTPDQTRRRPRRKAA